MRRARMSESTLWLELAADCSTEAAVRTFFARRQQQSVGGPKLSIKEVIKVENPRSLRAFTRGAAFDIRPLRAHQHGADTLLFHGCPAAVAANIQAEGLLLSFASDGMLHTGLCMILLIRTRTYTARPC